MPDVSIVTSRRDPSHRVPRQIRKKLIDSRSGAVHREPFCAPCSRCAGRLTVPVLVLWRKEHRSTCQHCRHSLMAANKPSSIRPSPATLGRPGALLGILEAVQEHHPHKYLSAEALRYVAGQAGHSAVAHLQLRDVLCAVQPGAAGRQHRLHLPRHGVPHAQLAQPAGEPAPGAWARLE